LQKGIVESLFDFSFSSFITGKIIKFLYMISILLVGFISLGIFISGAENGGAAAFGALIFAVVFFAMGVLYARVLSEILIIFFRMLETLDEISNKLDALSGLGSSQDSPDDGNGDLSFDLPDSPDG